jgi:hypothetical protein
MNILDALLQAEGGQMAGTLGQRFGLDGGQTQSALEALLPALAGAVQQNVQQPGGLEALMGALGSGQHGRYLDDPSALGDPATTDDGNGILGHLFGSREVSREVASRAAAQTGLGADLLKQMLPVVAAMMMGGLARGAGGATAAPSAGDAGLGGLGAALGGMGGLGQVLGSVLGDGTGAPPAGIDPGARGQGGAGGLMGMLTPMLDRNRDGSAMDDLLGMAASFLAKR